LEAIYLVVLIGASLVLAAIFTSIIAFRFGAPLLLIFLLVGLVAGEDGLGLRFDNAPVAYFVGSLALAVILFDSGFGTRIRSVRLAGVPAVLLASLGVVLTAAITGIAARLAFGFGWIESFLLGAIVGSTDAAAVFFLLRVRGITIIDRVRSTLEIESASNDPMAIFLTITLTELLVGRYGDAGLGASILTGFFMQMGLGFVMGLVGGFVIVRIIDRIVTESALYALIALTAAMALFGITGILGGSGFLAVFVAGVYAGNRGAKRLSTVRAFQDGMTWLAQIVMFLVLGLFATPSQFPMVIGPAIAVAIFLTFVARPAAVWLCLLPFRYPANETAFISWVGLRGAVSILLGIVPLFYGLPNGQLLFNAAFIMVVTSLLVQGWTVRPMARRLNLIVPQEIGPVEKVELELPGTAHHELVTYRVVPDSPIARGERLPRWARPSLVVRDGESMRYQYAGRIRPDDRLYIFASPRFVRLLDRLFASPAGLEADDREFFGAFALEPSHRLGELIEAYDLNLPKADPEETIALYMTERLGGSAEVGDQVSCDKVNLIVRATDDDGGIAAVGMAIERPEPALPGWGVLKGLIELAPSLRRRLGRRPEAKAEGSKD
jgi:potassium/hydrogen antiporter